MVAMRKAAAAAGTLTSGGGGSEVAAELNQLRSVMEEQIEEILKQVRESNRAAMEAQLRKQFGLPDKTVSAAPASGELTADFTGNTGTIDGVEVEEVTMSLGGTPVRTVLAADETEFEGGSDFVSINAKLDVLYHEITEGIPGAEDRSFMSDIHLMDRMPIRVMMLQEGKEWARNPDCPAAQSAELDLPNLPIRTSPF